MTSKPSVDAIPAGERRIILVVDDELLIRWSLREGLAEEGYDVLEAASGADARSMFNGGVDAVILDIRLPDVNGLELLREFRAKAPKTVVIVISAHAGRDLAEQVRHDGAYELVHKPFDVDHLSAMLATALGAS